jgi:hypothetical protein
LEHNTEGEREDGMHWVTTNECKQHAEKWKRGFLQGIGVRVQGSGFRVQFGLGETGISGGCSPKRG